MLDMTNRDFWRGGSIPDRISGAGVAFLICLNACCMLDTTHADAISDAGVAFSAACWAMASGRLVLLHFLFRHLV